MLNAFVYISIVQLSFIKHATQRKRALYIPSFSAMYLSDKIFLTLLVPVAVTLFCSVPPLVIQELPGYVPSIKYPKNLFVLPDIRSLLKWNQYAKPLEDEIPLVFVHEKYPQSGNKKFSLHEYKYLKMAEKMAEAKTQNEDPQPSHIGYVYIYDSIKSKELPTGELLEVTDIEWQDDGCLLSTERRKSFKIKSIRRDETQAGIVLAKVEWI